ncbi:1,4-alpha-glucan branching protein GlgB [Paenibacillus frigoriresistens]|uniref:1,4-alpha-glucan branching protein GlgB n=1 Tax=Paenibacillus alginolyticus TaxID=59839 RepID=UPI0015669BCB|nr:1,4-alpha-glucan branching protein GlgB [Paenibacillus frigoriresistens]NRF92185.1 1,4-alpha-glucan branching protein GlgB [Paenibacillus frigoriresistens]
MTTLASEASSDALYLLHEGTQYQSYHFLGSHVEERSGQRGVNFAVWAPNAKQVNVSGSFNGWNGSNHQMSLADGVWTLFIPELGEGTLYKYEIVTLDDECYLKSDPYAFHSELRPGTASIISSLEGYEWQDEEWLANKTSNQFLQQPLLIYEVHLGSWKRKEDGGFYSYAELAEELVDYVHERGYTHIELMPLEEHPLDASWGYQVTSYFSVTSRFGSPKDFMYFVDRCHQKGIGVIMDWVPAHFCKDAHGLTRFDGTPLYEYADRRKGEHPTWGTQVFDYAKPEVLSFLISNALFWMDVYHLDGLRVDAVYSILSLNFDREETDWIVNEKGGEENLEGISFLQKLNAVVFSRYPNALMMAEDTSSYPGVTAPVENGGLGFNYKWNLGFTWNTLAYMKKNQEERSSQEDQLTNSLLNAWDENYILPYAHDEVVHTSKSLLGKMSGDDNWQRFANLRVLYTYMMGHPGKKLLFMGNEFGQIDDWNSEASLEWDLLEFEEHQQFEHFVKMMNHFYIAERALWELDYEPSGFEPIHAEDKSDGLVTFVRKAENGDEQLVILCNFKPEAHEGYRLGVMRPGRYQEVFNSDRQEFGGSGVTNENTLVSEEWTCQDCSHSITVSIPPLAAIVLKYIPSEG